MDYHLTPPLFGIEPQTSFDEAWEVFCCELLNLENDTMLIRRRTPPDLGADLIWDEKKVIYQCKSSKDGQGRSFSIDKAEKSIARALANREIIGWQKYVLCTNVNLTGEIEQKLKAVLPEIEILGEAYWVNLCRKFHQEEAVISRFRYQSYSLPEPIWNIPSYLKNPLFTGREEVLEQIYNNLNTGNTTALMQPQAIHGLGGIGKTQCAVEYASRRRKEYRYIFWVNASTHETLTTSYIDLASRLHLLEQKEPEQDKIVEAVKQWLYVHDNWLLIADNAEDINLTSTFLPTTNTGHILLTTREPTGGRFQSVEVKKMEEEEGTLMLLRRAGQLEQASLQDREQARVIVLEMDGLPLALDQAGAYIKENPSTLAEYLETYKRKQTDLLQRRGRFWIDHPASVATTWSLNFEQVKQNNPLAADVMRVCAFLAPDDIPEDLFVRGVDKLGSLLRTLTNDPTLLREAVGELSSFSLMRRNPNKHTLSIHRLVQIIFKSAMKKDEQKKWAKRVVYAIKDTFPVASDIASWEVCQQYLPHALVCFDLIQQYNITSVEAALLLQNVANYQSERASYDTVEQMYQRALTIIKQHHPHNDALANIFYDFARFYYDQGDYEQAELLLQRAITINEQEAVEINIARNYNLLAALYYAQGEYEQAEVLLQRVLVIHEHSLGPDHPSTAMSLNNLAVLYYAQGEHEPEEHEPEEHEPEEHEPEEHEPEEHEPEEHEPEEHEPEEHEPGKYEQAETLYQRALAIHEHSLDADQSNTAMTLNNLAALYYVQGKYKQAEILLQRALAIYEYSSGPDHPNTAMSLNNLAELYYAQGDNEQAETCYQRALAICEHSLGSDHHSTVIVRSNYMDFHQATNYPM